MRSGSQKVFRALADPTRRQILEHLSHRDMTISEVADQFEITRGAVRKHLTILEEGRLISARVAGRDRVNRLEPMALLPVVEWLSFFDRFWDERLHTLKSIIEQQSEQETD